ncbi:MAG: CoA-binding protein [Syntrophales bacterium]|jgi:acyl-CoA synthetase (NDP forming)|nr:CoA-binding protein [Syntrophales bacterium]MDY0045427.1 CoA-binding protein [Syntrophales bacterium]
MKYSNLDKLFNPRTIALVGASANPVKWGFIVFFNILKGEFTGPVYPVNPKIESLLGIPCYPSIETVPDSIDLAVITTPAPTVSSLIDECGRKGVSFVVVITSDFSETGAKGADMEQEIVEKARSYGMRLVGPNTMGIFSAKTHLHALMPPVMPLHGSLSMFSQSGNVGVQMLYWGINKGVGYEKFVSSGNEGDLRCEDYLGYFAEDEATTVILAYLEGIDPDSELYRTARWACRKKPVLIFKGGRTKTGGKAAASHSGAMAVSSKVLKAAFHQAGIIEIDDSQGLVDCAKAFSAYPIPRGSRIAILTRGGGWGVITADACEEHGLIVPPLSREILEKLNTILPPYWSHANPVDMAAVITSKPYLECLEILAQWDEVDAVIALGGSIQGALDFKNDVKGTEELKESLAFAREIAKDYAEKNDIVLDLARTLVDKTGKPIIMVTLGDYEDHKSDLTNHRVVSYPTPERAVRALARMVDYRRFLNSPDEDIKQ